MGARRGLGGLRPTDFRQPYVWQMLIIYTRVHRF